MDSGAIQMPPALGPEASGWFDLFTLPWRRYEIFSRLAPGEVVEAMRNATEPRRWFRWPSRLALGFEGTVEADSFLVSRIIRYRNSFLPFITGRIEPAPGGTRILISMRPHLFVLIFMAVWMAFPIAIAVFVLWHGARQGPALVLFPFGMVVFGYLLCSIAFGLEARRALKMLQNILQPSGAGTSAPRPF